MTREKELKDLHEIIHDCSLCPLHETRTNAVPGEGPVNAQLFFIGEAPGAQEDETGKPFVGRSGKLLISMIEDIGFSRENVFMDAIAQAQVDSIPLAQADEGQHRRTFDIQRAIQTF